MKWSYALLLLVALLLTLSPFLLLSGEFRAEQAAGVTYRATYSAAVKSMDPATCGDVTSASIQGNIYEGLYTYHFLKRPVEVVCQLAADFPQVSDNGLTYTIPLRTGVLFHRNPCFGDKFDGVWPTREVTADDFVFAFKRIADYHISTGLAWAFLAERIEGLDAFREQTRLHRAGDFSRYDREVSGLRAIAPDTLQIRLVTPFPQFIYVLAMNTSAPIPREVIDYWLAGGDGGRATIPEHERSTEITEQEQVVGTGPFLLSEWKRKWKITLDRNPDFRFEVYPHEGEPPSEGYPGDSALGLLDDAGKQVPFIDRVQFRFMEEEYASWMMFLSGRTDVGSIPREAFDNVISPNRELTGEWERRGIYLHRSSYPAIFWYVFNMEDPVLGGSPSLRRALCLAYDVESEIEVLLNGRARRAVNILPSSFKGYQEAGPGPYARYDLQEAQRLIVQARAELDARGLLENGEIPEIRLDLTSGPHPSRVAEFARQQFAPLGIRIRPVFNDWPTLQRKVANKQVQMYTMGWHADYPDAENFLQLYYGGNIDKGTNNANYRNPTFDSLYEVVRLMPDSPQRTELYARMVSLIANDCPVLPLYEPESFTLFNKWAGNVKAHPIGYGYLMYRRVDTRLRSELTRRRGG